MRSFSIVALVVPNEVFKSLIARRGRLRVELLQALAEIVVEPGIGPAIAGRLGGFVMKLQQALGVGEGAVDFADLGGREDKTLRS